jgi:hypothetical protein
VPVGRGQWRLLSAQRPFAAQAWTDLATGELAQARSRRLEQKWNAPATLSFAVDGRADAAAAIAELQTDVIALRWDDQTGRDIPVFRGPVTQSQDTLSEQAHTVTFTCHDYSALLWRRLLTATVTYTQIDQDTIVAGLLNRAVATSSSSGTSLTPGSYLPLTVYQRNPDGSARSVSGQKRDRTYYPNSQIGQLFDDLSKVQGGFDWDVAPAYANPSYDGLRIFYPYQGVVRTAPALVYGSTVATVSRSINSGDYGNYVRVVGNNGSSDPNAPQLFAEAWNPDANDITRIPIGLWMHDENAADVSVQATLNDKAAGDLAQSGIVVPNYTIGLRPGAYSWGNPNMGDVVPLVIQAGRLNVNTTIRVLGITFDVGDDGQEDVTLTVGRPTTTLAGLLAEPVQDTAALTRR